MSDIGWLEAENFKLVGQWLNPHLKLQRRVRLQRTPGIYAFVVDGRVCYIGKASYLRSRLRGYNRSLGSVTSRGFREVHLRISEAWKHHTVIDVWVHDHIGDSLETLEQLEARWIKQKQPNWNVAGIAMLGGILSTDS